MTRRPKICPMIWVLVVNKIVPPHDAWSTIDDRWLVINGAMYSLDATLPIGRLTKFVKRPMDWQSSVVEESCWFVGQRGRWSRCMCTCLHDAYFLISLMWVLRENFSLFYFLASLGGIFSFLVTLRDLDSNSLVEGPWPWGTFDTNSSTYTSLKVSTSTN